MTGYLLRKRTRYLLFVLEGEAPNNYGFRTFHFADDARPQPQAEILSVRK